HRVGGFVARAEHEVVDEKLRAAAEQLRQCLWAVAGLEDVLLVDPNPRKRPALSCEFVTEPGVFFLPLQQLGTRRLPLFPCRALVGCRCRFHRCLVLLGAPFRRAWNWSAAKKSSRARKFSVGRDDSSARGQSYL